MIRILLSMTSCLVASSAMGASYYLSKPKIPAGAVLSTESVVADMPPNLSQDSFGLCYGFSAATVLNYEYCQEQKVLNKSYVCSTMKESERFSPIAISRYTDSGGTPGVRDSHFKSLPWGGSPTEVLHKVTEVLGEAATEECASLDKFLDKIGGTKEGYTKAQEAILLDFTKRILSVQKKTKDCPKCLSSEYAAGEEKKVRDTFNVPTDEDGNRVLKAFGKDTYEKALNELMYPTSCGDSSRTLKLARTYKVSTFPKEKLPQKNGYALTMAKIEEVLSSKTPHPMILAFCAAKKPSPQCKSVVSAADGNQYEATEGHGLVIVGYRKYCDAKKNCSYSLKVQNSYGEGWQRLNDDGWIDAKSILDSSFYDKESLTWIEEDK